MEMDPKITYLCHVRLLLEYACPIWGSQVQSPENLSFAIETVQKRGAKIILGANYLTYVSILKLLKILSP